MLQPSRFRETAESLKDSSTSLATSAKKIEDALVKEKRKLEKQKMQRDSVHEFALPFDNP